MGAGGLPPVLIVLAILVAGAGYLAGAGGGYLAGAGGGRAPWRAVSWCAGLVVTGVSVAGPLANSAAHDIRAHMVVHLLLGMLAPVLLVMAAPVSMALRTLPVTAARRLSRVLRSGPVRALTHPLVAAALAAGGPWALYTTGLYAQMGRHVWVHVLVHVHLLAAGYLFTAAVIGIDPAPHRPGRPVRAAALFLFLAAHDVLAKTVYARPPEGVPAGSARTAAELMYYGGGAIDLIVIIIFCGQWYAAADPRRRHRPVRPARRPAAARPAVRAWRLPADMRRP
jgi:putative membrane protein